MTMGDDLRTAKELDELDEKELLARAKLGDRRAWKLLLIPLRKRLLKEMRARFRNEPEIEDLVQEVLAKVFKNIHQFREESLLYTWAWTTARRQFSNRLRARAAQIPLAEQYTAEDADGYGMSLRARPATPEESAADQDSLRSLDAALGTLNPAERAMVERPMVDEMVAEGEEGDETPGASSTGANRVALHRARHKLKVQFQMVEEKGKPQ
jgi:RNA polymerase sigma-70 factor (ECF subfamily)